MSRLERKRRITVATLVALFAIGGTVWSGLHQQLATQDNASTIPQSQQTNQSPASTALAKLAVKGRAPKTGYARTQFSNGWAAAGGCDMRNKVLQRDLINVHAKSSTDCTILNGTLNDPYTGKAINFVRGPGTSTAVQIDHVVAISDAWQTGAQQLSKTTRHQLYNDPLELLAVDGPANDNKSDGDAATWLPPNKTYRCRYVARQIAVKLKYHLWVTPAEHDAIQRVLGTCPSQALPVTSN
jgi:hypothetical protein